MNGTMHVAPPYEWVIFATILIYLATVWYLLNYLKRIHPDTWSRLGSPLFVPQIGYVLPSIRFIFGGRYKLLNDPNLTPIIWAVRLLFALCSGLIIFGTLFHLLPPR